MEKDYYGLPPWYRLNRREIDELLNGSINKWKLANLEKGFNIKPPSKEQMEQARKEEPAMYMDGIWEIMTAAREEDEGVKDIPFEVVSSRLLKDEEP